MPQSRPIILTAAPVGFSADGALDLAASRRILKFIAGSGTDGAFVIGTTGEFASLSREERRQLAELSVEVLVDKRVVVHVGAASLHEVKQLIADAREASATAVAVLTPYYLPASDAAILHFFTEAAAAAAGLDVYAYLFADRTGNPVSPDLLARLAAIPGIVGAKISGEDLATLAAFRAAVPTEFELFTGGDRDIAQVLAHGGNGVVSGIASVFPEPFVAVAQALEEGTDTTALQADVDIAVDVVIGDPERMKVGLAARGIDAGTSRMALDEVDESTRMALRQQAQRYA